MAPLSRLITRLITLQAEVPMRTSIDVNKLRDFIGGFFVVALAPFHAPIALKPGVSKGSHCVDDLWDLSLWKQAREMATGTRKRGNMVRTMTVRENIVDASNDGLHERVRRMALWGGRIESVSN